jgi:CubicO group peptidase (beta-lactamase class C family)
MRCDAMLVKVTNGTWEEWVAAEIMQPLGMRASGPCLRTAADVASLVDGVNPETGRKVPYAPHTDKCPWGAPCGSIFSTAADMAAWVGFLAGHPSAAAAAVLDAASVREMQSTMMVQACPY